MARKVELESLIIKIIGDASHYQAELLRATKATQEMMETIGAKSSKGGKGQAKSVFEVASALDEQKKKMEGIQGLTEAQMKAYDKLGPKIKKSLEGANLEQVQDRLWSDIYKKGFSDKQRQQFDALADDQKKAFRQMSVEQARAELKSLSSAEIAAKKKGQAAVDAAVDATKKATTAGAGGAGTPPVKPPKAPGAAGEPPGGPKKKTYSQRREEQAEEDAAKRKLNLQINSAKLANRDAERVDQHAKRRVLKRVSELENAEKKKEREDQAVLNSYVRRNYQANQKVIRDKASQQKADKKRQDHEELAQINRQIKRTFNADRKRERDELAQINREIKLQYKLDKAASKKAGGGGSGPTAAAKAAQQRLDIGNNSAKLANRQALAEEKSHARNNRKAEQERATAQRRMLAANKRANRELIGQMEEVRGHVASFALGISLPILAAIGVSVKAYADFNQAMTESTSIMKVNQQQIQAMEDQAIKLSKVGPQAPAEIAKGYYFLASAGLSAEQTMRALPAVQAFATAGAFDLSVATTLAVDAQSALGMRSKDAAENLQNLTRVTDALTQASIISNANIQQLSIAITTQFGASLKSVNKTIEEGMVLLSAYASQGIKSEIAGTAGSRFVRLLGQASRKKTVAHEKLGFDVFDKKGNMREFTNIVENLEDITKGMSDQMLQATLAQLGFDARIQQSITPLLGMSTAMRQYELDMKNAAGTTAGVAKKQMESFTNQMKVTYNQLMVVAISVGATVAPALRKLGQVVVYLTEVWRSLTPALKSAIVWTVVLTSTMLFALGTVAVAAYGLNVLFAGLPIVVGILVTAIAALVGGTVIFGGTLLTVTGTFDALATYIEKVWKWLEPTRKAFEGFGRAAGRVFDAILMVIKTEIRTWANNHIKLLGMVVGGWDNLQATMIASLITTEYALGHLDQAWVVFQHGIMLKMVQLDAQVRHYFDRMFTKAQNFARWMARGLYLTDLPEQPLPEFEEKEGARLLRELNEKMVDGLFNTKDFNVFLNQRLNEIFKVQDLAAKDKEAIDKKERDRDDEDTAKQIANIHKVEAARAAAAMGSAEALSRIQQYLYDVDHKNSRKTKGDPELDRIEKFRNKMKNEKNKEVANNPPKMDNNEKVHQKKMEELALKQLQQLVKLQGNRLNLGDADI